MSIFDIQIIIRSPLTSYNLGLICFYQYFIIVGNYPVRDKILVEIQLGNNHKSRSACRRSFRGGTGTTYKFTSEQ